MNSKEILKILKSHSNKKNVEGMARFGISSKNTLGVSMPIIRKLGKQIGKDHELAQELWNSKIHEARILASLIDNPKEVTEKQMDSWVKDFDSWDVCDQVCMNLFDRTPFVENKIFEWSKSNKEFVKRASFSLIASTACHRKEWKNEQFIRFLPLIKKASTDERNFVRKAVNWALRGIGKRNLILTEEALRCSKEIQKLNNKTAKWIANDAIRELELKKRNGQIKSNY
jgi:3-methyladenine DNA glycosylase AlkD